ncbi:MAG: hypothetical protein K2L54_04490, partial [Clostridiales bacterium]|nr:hypothetical protein [Clostridiales bacterium]
MTTTRKRLTAIVTALALLFAALFALGGSYGKTAYALVPEYEENPHEYDALYYFTDYCQVVNPERLAHEFYNRDVIVDRQIDLDETKLAQMIQNGYFYGFNDFSVVIIDIKTFKPDPFLLYDLFYSLKWEQNCVTSFVTVYEYDQFNEEDGTYYDPWFMDCVDIFIDDSNYDRLNSFIDNSFQHLIDTNGTVDNTAYLIDGYLVDVGTERDLGDYPYYGDSNEGSEYIKNNFGADMDTLCTDSPFLGIFVKHLVCLVDPPYWYDPNRFESYKEIADVLKQKDIKLLVYMGGSRFVDILTWEVKRNDPFEFITGEADIPYINNICVFGFWELTRDFYEYFNIKAMAGELIPPIYILIVDYPYNDDGLLPVITDSELSEMYGNEWDDAAY